MVRLKPEKFGGCSVVNIRFQFHYGAIKTIQSIQSIRRKRKFQFHYGAIKTAQQCPWTDSSSSFQFHYGAIKTKSKLVNNRVYLCFNSTMVRLKPILSI